MQILVFPSLLKRPNPDTDGNRESGKNFQAAKNSHALLEKSYKGLTVKKDRRPIRWMPFLWGLQIQFG